IRMEVPLHSGDSGWDDRWRGNKEAAPFAAIDPSPTGARNLHHTAMIQVSFPKANFHPRPLGAHFLRQRRRVFGRSMVDCSESRQRVSKVILPVLSLRILIAVFARDFPSCAVLSDRTDRA